MFAIKSCGKLEPCQNGQYHCFALCTMLSVTNKKLNVFGRTVG